MKHFKKESKRQKQIHRLKILIVLFLLTLIVAAVTVYMDYQARPGFLEKVWVSDKGADYITVAWEAPRNVYKYVIEYNGKTLEFSGRNKSAKIDGLKEDTLYEFSVRADSKKREGFDTLIAKARTKKATHIKGEANQMRFANRQTDLKQTAETQLTYLPGKGYTVTTDGKVIFSKSGKVTVKVKTVETAVYASTEKEIKVEVLDSVNVKAKGATPHIFYKLNEKNCECVKKVKGINDVSSPQSFAYIDGKYIISYVNKRTQRIVTFGDQKTKFIPKKDLGHANGLTIAKGRCYSVRGAGSTKCISFDPSNKEYNTFDLAYGASGIAYDESTDMFYTSARNNLTAYDSDFNVVNSFGRVRRKSTYYAQDCGAYGGIILQGISGSDYHGINYIDFYDMKGGKYLGSAECNLDEIESILVDEDGYIELLCNTKSRNDYIWKTPINMKKLCE